MNYRAALDEIVETTMRFRMRRFDHGYKPGLYAAARAACADIDPADREAVVTAIEAVFIEHEIRNGDAK